MGTLVESIDVLLEASGAKWRWPTQKEMRNEWDTEYDLRDLFDATGWSIANKGVYDQSRQRDFFMKNWKDFGRVETFKRPPRGIQFWNEKTIDDLKARTSHMGKDIDSLVDAMENRKPLPYPVLAKVRGKYKMLGGRTRFGIANLLGFPVKAFVFDPKKINPRLVEFLRQVWLDDPDASHVREFSKDDRKKVWDWVEKGARGDFPVEFPLSKKGVPYPPDLQGHFADMIEKTISRVLKDYK